MRSLLLVAAALAWALPARAQSTATLRAIDVYRSSRLPVDAVRQRFADRLRDVVSMRNVHRKSMDEKAEALRLQIEAEAAATPGVASVELHLSEYFTSVDHAMYAVFDVVDEADGARRAFIKAPKRRVPDPAGLLAAWKTFVETGEALSRRGQMPIDRPACPGFYCLWGGTPELDAAHQTFLQGASKQADELRKVIAFDADGEKRAEALFVLSYTRAGEKVSRFCRDALSDSDARVRGAALQILADIANNHRDVDIDLDAVLPRLDDPSSAVRGKAMGLLVPLAERPAYRKKMLSAAPRLVYLMRMEQPESRDLSFTVVGLLSKKSWERANSALWNDWAARAAAGQAE